MNKDLLELIIGKAELPAFRAFLTVLSGRYDEYEKIRARYRQMGKELRAKREGITVEDIEEESRKATVKWALRPDEIQRIRSDHAKRVRDAKNDAQLLRFLLAGEKIDRDREVRWLAWKKLPTENRPLHQEQLEFLNENRKLMLAFAESNGWPVPEGY